VPFGRCSAGVNPAGPNYGFLWTNLVKVDQDEHEPDWGIKEIVATNFPVLAEEIRIVKPDVIMFFTGPNYDHWIRVALPEVVFEPVEGMSERRCVRLVHQDLLLTYRVYHPSGIMRTLDRESYYRRVLTLEGL
jgi:hypothetical protein